METTFVNLYYRPATGDIRFTLPQLWGALALGAWPGPNARQVLRAQLVAAGAGYVGKGRVNGAVPGTSTIKDGVYSVALGAWGQFMENLTTSPLKIEAAPQAPTAGPSTRQRIAKLEAQVAMLIAVAQKAPH